MSSVLTDERRESVWATVQGVMKESTKQALKEALAEAEAERARRSRTRRLLGSLTFLGIGTAIGYGLAQRDLAPEAADAAETVAERTREAAEPVGQEQPEREGRGLVARLVVVGIATGVTYALRRWMRSRDRTPPISERPESVADRTERAADRAADRIEAGGRRAAEGVEEAGEAAEDVREQTKESIEERGDEEE